MTQTLTLRIGHSPDPDDAFMFYALAKEAEGIDGIAVEHVLEDIESLNRRALTAELEVTAVSAAAYPELQDTYWIMRTGASMGRGYGPILVAKTPMDPADLAGKTVAIPGEKTTANLLLGILFPGVNRVVVDFDRIPDAVRHGDAEVGLLIHEGQITYAEEGLHRIADFGEIWEKETDGLPLPLGLDLVRKDLGREMAERISTMLRRSIAHALANEDDALEYALEYGRGITREVGRKFVRMYVNEDTLDMGDPGVAALRHLYRRAMDAGLLDRMPEIDLV
ncbi:MAG: ABC transporter substrate-binding protein [Gemmatimonadota bacterium]|nr:ABC transporter substrate-binding protein [Gemmatimonadota bacterium]MDP6529173.1 ABC transporter substrate-binding protein [Gemmatimonadota bacterium]MDP6802862.1 ABC transporter substrate-binding protein [Gemmatimonadota bacterium]MDP7032192.1 ABC transporter substrate-binding protein [Gemmatimonadota bacterium]